MGYSDQSSAPKRAASGAWQAVAVLLVLAASLWGAVTFLKPSTGRTLGEAILYEVKREDFELAITERGEIESAGDVEVRSQVQAKNQPGLTILSIVPEGTAVNEGDFLVELDSSALREEMLVQQINVNTAEALVVEAKNTYESAVIAKREYDEGTFVQEKETYESELFVAEENLSRAEEYLKYSKKLAAKGYVNDLQLKADEFALDKARKEADAAKTKLRVLEQFTREKMLKELDSAVLIAKAKWESEKNSLQLELDKLQDVKEQIAKCIINSPRAGVVKYAHEDDHRGSDDFVVEEGAIVRERQVILRLPDPSQMRVEMNINESLIQHVRPGMVAAIEPIGSGGVTLRGTVDRVNQYAEPTGWRKANVKEYKAFVAIDEPSDLLRTGMTASVTIRSMFRPNVLKVPVQAVYSHGDDQYCFVSNATGGVEPREVECGPTNDKFFVIESGLEESERVAVNPRALADYVSLPELDPEQSQQLGGSAKPFERLSPEKPKPTIASSNEQSEPAAGG